MMIKKPICVILALCFVTSFLAGCKSNTESPNTTPTGTEHTIPSQLDGVDPSESDNSENHAADRNITKPQMPDKNSERGPCRESPELALLHVEYESKIATASSNADITDINAAYAIIWAEYVDAFYVRIIDMTDGQLQEAMIKQKESWTQYATTDIEAYRLYLERVYSGGSIVPVACSKYEYDLYRAKALELYQMFILLERHFQDELEYEGEGLSD